MPAPTKKLGDMPSTLDLNESDLPQLKNWKIGGKYKIVLEVEQIRAGKGYDGEGPHTATFKVLSANSAGESKSAPSTPPPTTRKDRVDVLKAKAKEA